MSLPKILELDGFRPIRRPKGNRSDNSGHQNCHPAAEDTASGGRYGARKVWHALRREGHDIARCTVERLMKAMGLQGVVRGKKVVTTNPDTSQSCPDDKVNRTFAAEMPNQLCPYGICTQTPTG